MNPYHKVVEKSALGYLNQLTAVEGEDKEDTRKVISLYEHALDEASDEVILHGFDEAYLALAQARGQRRRRAFCNEFSLGMGNPDAEIAFLGQELAFGLNSTFNFITEASLLTFLWLLDIQGRKDLLWKVNDRLCTKFPRKLAQQRLLFHRFPNSFHQVEKQRHKQGHTWRVMSKFISSLLGVQATLEDGPNNFACRSYFFELGAEPSPKHKGTSIPSPRKEFIKSLTDSLSNVKYLIVHGSLGEFRRHREEYLSMLGIDPKLKFEDYPLPRGQGQWLQYGARWGERIVFLTQQLSGSNRFPRNTYDDWAEWLKSRFSN